MKAAPVVLSLAEIRAIALRSQGLADNAAPFGTGKDGVLNAVQHLGYVQVDTVSVIQRAHHHVLWSRVPDYQLEVLHELQSPDAAVFEYWNHAASYLPTRDYRFSLPLMRKYRGQLHWGDDTPELQKAMRKVMRLIHKNGPLMISDVDSDGGSGGWGSALPGKIERRALHELWMRGAILIRSRKGFQKVFDLPERVLPTGTDIKLPSSKESAEFHVCRALRALGVAQVPELHYMQDAGRADAARTALSALLKRGEAVEIRMADEPKKPLFALREALELRTPLQPGVVRFLSPFDNLVIQRKRLKWLFDFDYTVEMYVPAAKRKYGYFVLPILWGDRLIGRMDAKANRAEKQLVIHSLLFEPSFRDWNTVKPALVEALNRFARFQQCHEWKIARVEPKSFRIS